MCYMFCRRMCVCKQHGSTINIILSILSLFYIDGHSIIAFACVVLNFKSGYQFADCIVYSTIVCCFQQHIHRWQVYIACVVCSSIPKANAHVPCSWLCQLTVVASTDLHPKSTQCKVKNTSKQQCNNKTHFPQPLVVFLSLHLIFEHSSPKIWTQ